MFQNYNQQPPQVNISEPDILVMSAIYFPVGTYNEQYLRPYVASEKGDVFDPNVINHISEMTRGGTNLNAQSFSTIDSFITPQASTTNQAVILNGWRELRRIFVIRLRITNFSVSFDRFLYGFTEGEGFTLDGLIDPTMRHVVNSFVDVRQQLGKNSFGQPTWKWHVIENSQMLKPDLDGGYTDSSNIAMRPQDVIQASETCIMEEMHPGIRDGRLDFSCGTKLSSRDNNSPTQFMAKTFNALSKARCAVGGLDEAVAGEFTSHAVGLASEMGGYNDTMFSELDKVSNSNLLKRGIFTYNELKAITPIFNETVHPRAKSAGTFSYAEHSEHWGGADNNTLGAILIAQSVPGILLSCLIPGAQINIKNSVAGMEYLGTGSNYLTTLMPLNTLVDGLAEAEVDTLIQRATVRIETEVMNTITKNGYLSIEVDILANCFQEITIKIAIEGQPQIMYVAPAFSDSLTAPTIAPDLESLKTLGSDMNYLVEQIWSPDYQGVEI